MYDLNLHRIMSDNGRPKDDRIRAFITLAATKDHGVSGKYIRHLLSTIHSNLYPFKDPTPVFHAIDKDRWSWYALSGKLFWSGERMRFKHQYVRDYVRTILDRWIRIHGKTAYLSKKKAFDFYDRVTARWGWPMPTHVKYYIPRQPNFASTGWWDDWAPRDELIDKWKIDGFYSKVAYVNSHGDPFFCPNCGGQAMSYKQFNDIHHYYEDAQYTCLNRLCREATLFMRGKHDLWSAARTLRVSPRRPHKKYAAAVPENKGIIAIAAMLDFEARYEQKKNKYNDAICVDRTN